MSDTLESRFVFVDTSMYESKNFQFEAHSLGRFSDLCIERKLYLLINSVVDGEIISHLITHAHDAARHIKDFKKTIKIIRNLPELAHHGIFSELTKETIEILLINKYSEFKDKAVSHWIDVDLAKPSDIIKYYFNKTPPFSNKKKDEFPDAIMLLSLLGWAKESKNMIYILSSDNDVKEFCSTSDNHLAFVSDIDKFINLVLTNEEELKDASRFALERFNSCIDSIKSHLEASINDIEYSSAGYDVDGDIDSINAYNLFIEDINIIKSDREYAEFSITVKFIVDATHNITDYDRSIWDSEDKRYIFTAETNLEIRHEVTCQAYAWIDFEDGLAVNTKLGDIYIQDSYIELDPYEGIELGRTEHGIFEE